MRFNKGYQPNNEEENFKIVCFPQKSGALLSMKFGFEWYFTFHIQLNSMQCIQYVHGEGRCGKREVDIQG